MSNLNSLIQDFLQYTEVERNLSQGTIKMYHLYLNQFAEFLKDELSLSSPTLKDVTKENITAYRVFLNRKPSAVRPKETLSKSTQNCFLIALRSFLKYLSVEKELKVLDSNKITLAKTGDRVPKFLTQDEINKMFAMQNTSKKSGVRDRAILELLYSTGMRVSEVCSLAPDIDNASTEFWKQFRGGSILGPIISPFFGGHRLISHSILGITIFGILASLLTNYFSSIILVDMNLVWYSFMIGVVSHLLADSFTKEGIPLFFPLPIHLGIPPFRFLRITTGGPIEKAIVFPGLIALTGYLIYSNVAIFTNLVK